MILNLTSSNHRNNKENSLNKKTRRRPQSHQYGGRNPDPDLSRNKQNTDNDSVLRTRVEGMADLQNQDFGAVSALQRVSIIRHIQFFLVNYKEHPSIVMQSQNKKPFYFGILILQFVLS